MTGEFSYACGRDNWVDGSNISLLLDLARNPGKELNKYEQDMAAVFIKNGLLEKTDNGLKVMLPIFSRETCYSRIQGIVSEALRDTADEFQKIIGKKAEEILLPYVRKDLMGNFIYWDMLQFFQPIGYLFYYGMYESECLAIPEDYSRSAAGLCIITD